MVFSSSGRQPELSTKQVDSVYKSKTVWFVQLQPGTFQEESSFFDPVPLYRMTTVTCVQVTLHLHLR